MPRISTGALLAASSALSYGCLGVLAKLAYGEGWNVPSLLAVRFAFAALTVAPLALLARGSWRGFWASFAIGAVGYTATTAFYFPSLRLLPAAVASFLLFLSPALVAIWSRLFLRERFGWRGRLALGLALTGLVLISLGAWMGTLSTLGVLLALGSAFAFSLVFLAGRTLMAGRGTHWARAALATSLGAATSYLVFGAATGTLAFPAAPLGWLYAFGIGTLATGVALAFFYAALERSGATRVAVVSTLEPVATLALAAIVLSEVPSVRGIVGGLLIVAAAILVATDAGAD